MIEVKAPKRIKSRDTDPAKFFLAGSIEMGAAIKWQDKLVKALKDCECILFNPRRTDWDSSWVQDPTPGTKFHEQVTWELEHIQESDMVIFYFDPKTQSPITLLELGVVLASEIPAIVCCPDGYFRKGNVVITCEEFDTDVLDTFDEMLAYINLILDSIDEE